MVSGIVMMTLYPLAAAMAEMAIPVLPDVGSMIVPPGFSLPVCSASSMMALPIRSLADPAGFLYSSFV